MAPLKYTAEAFEAAYKAVLEGMPIRRAGREYGIPESTLRSRLANPRGLDAVKGAPTLFNLQQEGMLAEYCIFLAHLGYGLARWQVLEMARMMLEAIGLDITPSYQWFYSFLRRFPQLKMMKPKKREKARENAVNKDMLKSYFDALGAAMDDIQVKNIPASIWNIDETGISLDHNPPKVVALAGTHPHSVTSGKSDTTTVIAAVSALGETIPPYVIFKGDRLSTDLKTGGIPGTEYRMSKSGWVNSELFLDFFKNHLLRHVTIRPCLILYDGHSTHYNLELIQFARSQNVHLFVLPPHSSHCLQPLDVSFFSPMKNLLNSACHSYLHSNPNKVTTKQQLPAIIGSALLSAAKVTTIMSGFRKTGIFPFDPSALDVSPPTLDKKPAGHTATRKERQDNRSVRVLIDGQLQDFLQLKAAVEPKKPRKRFIPPCGALITSDEMYEKKRQETVMKRHKNQDEDSETVPKKKRPVFIPPPPSQSSTGAAGPSNSTPEEEDDTPDDSDMCGVCGKWQPDALLQFKGIKFVEWGQCEKCSKWIHLRFCTRVERLEEDDHFVCPNCPEQ